ncbi:MAG: mono/diheme cytochrome c family protein [Gammaproteobacteria bacterium]|jgi:mono/diheme cytochrome c family protein
MVKIFNVLRLTMLPFVVLLMTHGMSHASNIDMGETLHEEHCQRCHQNNIYTKPDRKVKDLAQLKEQVKQCELMNDLLWFEEDIDDVTDYLNAQFYLFDL